MGVLTREKLLEVALAHEVCPYYRGQEAARWCVVIVGDYKHFFDSIAMLHELALANAWRFEVLVDEAHNLADRARAMYGAELRLGQFRATRATAPASPKASFDRLERSWTRLSKDITAPYSVSDEPPRAFASALQDATAAISERLTESRTTIRRSLAAVFF
jgi:DNA excision repair protein ERCC-2